MHNRQSSTQVSGATWKDGTSKSLNNAFTQRPASVFAADKAEQAKATLARKGSHYGQATGAVGHGAAVMPTLSKRAQTRLKATPFSAPISPCTTAYKKAGTSTLIAPSLSVRAATNTVETK